MKLYAALYFLIILFTLPAHGQRGDWTTYYEQTGGKETPRYEETVEFCKIMSRRSKMITYTTFGQSARGKELPLVILDRDGLTDPLAIRNAGRIVVLLQACIHPGESEGKDAGMMLFRDFAFPSPSGKRKMPDPGILEKVSIIFIPIFNADGHERFGPYNRINQNGPSQMGWRTTATNLNLNRDFLKADTPEMQAWLGLFNHWLPEFFIDSHTTNGADYQYTMTYLMEIYGNMDSRLTAWASETFIPGFEGKMMEAGLPVIPYVGFRNWHDPRSGLVTEVAPPMLSQGYTSLRNRPGLLLETHMLKPYDQRVEATYQSVLNALQLLRQESENLRKLVENADKALTEPAFLKTPFPLLFETMKNDSTMIDFLGFEYHIEKSDLTGGNWFHYSRNPVTFKLPYFSKTKPVTTVMLPVAYIIPVEWKSVIERLRAHGVKMTELASDATVPIRTCRFNNPKWQQNPYEGRHIMTQISYDEIDEMRLFPAGSVIVETMQPAGRIIPHMLEPKGNGSFLYWGFFDAVFEQKEYGESYVMEGLAREMMKKDPALKKEFDLKMASDSLFAKSPWEIINWFYNRSPYADQRKGIYPVGRIPDEKTLRELVAP